MAFQKGERTSRSLPFFSYYKGPIPQLPQQSGVMLRRLPGAIHAELNPIDTTGPLARVGANHATFVRCTGTALTDKNEFFHFDPFLSKSETRVPLPVIFLRRSRFLSRFPSRRGIPDFRRLRRESLQAPAPGIVSGTSAGNRPAPILGIAPVPSFAAHLDSAKHSKRKAPFASPGHADSRRARPGKPFYASKRRMVQFACRFPCRRRV